MWLDRVRLLGYFKCAANIAFGRRPTALDVESKGSPASVQCPLKPAIVES
jgi:hypothetical protein